MEKSQVRKRIFLKKARNGKNEKTEKTNGTTTQILYFLAQISLVNTEYSAIICN